MDTNTTLELVCCNHIHITIISTFLSHYRCLHVAVVPNVHVSAYCFDELVFMNSLEQSHKCLLCKYFDISGNLVILYFD